MILLMKNTYQVDLLYNIMALDNLLMILVYKQNQHEYPIDAEQLISVIVAKRKNLRYLLYNFFSSSPTDGG